MWLAAAQQPRSYVLPACEASSVCPLRTLASPSQSVDMADVTPGGVVNVMAHGEVACNCPPCTDVQGCKTAKTTQGIAISLVKYYSCLCAIPEHTPTNRLYQRGNALWVMKATSENVMAYRLPIIYLATI